MFISYSEDFSFLPRTLLNVPTLRVWSSAWTLRVKKVPSAKTFYWKSVPFCAPGHVSPNEPFVWRTFIGCHRQADFPWFVSANAGQAFASELLDLLFVLIVCRMWVWRYTIPDSFWNLKHMWCFAITKMGTRTDLLHCHVNTRSFLNNNIANFIILFCIFLVRQHHLWVSKNTELKLKVDQKKHCPITLKIQTMQIRISRE